MTPISYFPTSLELVIATVAPVSLAMTLPNHLSTLMETLIPNIPDAVDPKDPETNLNQVESLLPLDHPGNLNHAVDHGRNVLLKKRLNWSAKG